MLELLIPGAPNKIGEKPALLAYMDQFKMLCGCMLGMIPLVFFFKRPPAPKHIELEAR